MKSYCPLHLPSTSLTARQKLPAKPGIYLFTVGSSILYVGKALLGYKKYLIKSKKHKELHEQEKRYDATYRINSKDKSCRVGSCIGYMG
jgi:hypothetical protein